MMHPFAILNPTAALVNAPSLPTHDASLSKERLAHIAPMDATFRKSTR